MWRKGGVRVNIGTAPHLQVEDPDSSPNSYGTVCLTDDAARLDGGELGTCLLPNFHHEDHGPGVVRSLSF